MRARHPLPLLCCALLALGCADATAPSAPAPTDAPLAGKTVPMGFVLTSVDAGSGAACGLASSGQAYCWGNAFALGNNSFTPSDVPVPVPGPGGSTTPLAFTAVTAGGTHVCGIAKSGQAFCWGANFSGALGSGTNPTDTYPIAVAPPAGATAPLTFISLSAGNATTCGVAKGGRAYCWGANSDGQLGNGTTGGQSNIPVPVAPPAGSTTPLTFTSISTASNVGFTCGVTKGGRAYCWGTNFSGQLGDGSSVGSSNVPVPVAPPFGFTTPLAFISLSTGAHHTCGVTTGAHIYCWGYDGFGALGDGSTGGSSNIPVPVSAGAIFTSVSAGYDFTCAATRSGQAYCWGAGGFGQLGNGTLTDTNVPVPVAGGFTFTSVSAGDAHTCAIAGKLGAFCWGSNSVGQLGNGNEGVDSYGPYPVANP